MDYYDQADSQQRRVWRHTTVMEEYNYAYLKKKKKILKQSLPMHQLLIKRES